MKKNVIKASLIVFILSLIAKLIGFVKSIIQASYFGTSIEMDAMNVASGFVSNILFMLTTAVSVAFVPLYIQHTRENNKRKQFATRTITALAIGCVAISILLFLLSPAVVHLIAPSFDKQALLITERYYKVLLIGMTFSLLANMYTSLLNAEKNYGLSTISSIVNSVVLIFFILFLSQILGVWALVISMPISFFLQWLILFCKGKKYATISLKYGLRDQGLKLLVLQATPILMSQATVEINQVVDRALLSSVTVGALTAVTYSAVLYQFATTLISTPLSTVMFTELSEAGANNEDSKIKSILNDSVNVILLIGIPVVLVMLINSTEIVTIVYGHGKFSEEAIQQCSQGLQMYGLCLIPVCVKTVYSRAYYSLNDTRRPMVIGILEVILNIALSVALVRPFGIIGVVGATAIASYVFIIIMLVDFNKYHKRVISLSDYKFIVKIFIGTMVSFLVTIAVQKFLPVAPLLNFFISGIICFLSYYVSLLVLRENNLLKLYRIIRNRFFSKKSCFK